MQIFKAGMLNPKAPTKISVSCLFTCDQLLCFILERLKSKLECWNATGIRFYIYYFVDYHHRINYRASAIFIARRRTFSPVRCEVQLSYTQPENAEYHQQEHKPMHFLTNFLVSEQNSATILELWECPIAIGLLYLFSFSASRLGLQSLPPHRLELWLKKPRENETICTNFNCRMRTIVYLTCLTLFHIVQSKLVGIENRSAIFYCSRD